MEGRGRQDLNLDTDTLTTHRGGKLGQGEERHSQGELFPDRWSRIGYAARKGDSYSEPKQILKRLVREIRRRASVRVLPLTSKCGR